MTDRFPRGAAVRRVNLEPAILFGAARALILQLAHPAVAAGVHDHSEFKTDPLRRLQGTVEATIAVVYGTEELAGGVGARLRWIHDFVVGPTYQANDPDNLLWVHATLADTALVCRERLVGPLCPADAEEYHRQMKEVATTFGVPVEKNPATLADFRAYVDRMVTTLEVTETGKDLIGFVLAPKLGGGLHVPMRPLLRELNLFSLGLLPRPIRDQLDVRWTAADEHRFEVAERRVRRIMTATPTSVRTAPTQLLVQVQLRRAARHVAAWRAAHDRAPVAPGPRS